MCGVTTSSTPADEDADFKVVAEFKATLGSLAWAGITVSLACFALTLAYFDISAYYLGHSLRSPSVYRYDLVGFPALISGVTKLLWVAALLILAFPRLRRYWIFAVLLLGGGFLIDNYVALPLQSLSGREHS